MTEENTTEYSILQQIPKMYEVAPCIRGEIQGDMLYISTVEKHGRCVLPEIGSYQGITLLKFFIKLIKSNHPDITKSELTDHAKLICGGIKVNLSDMMMLTHEKTYYELVGYRPYGRRYEERYEHNRNILSKLVWKKTIKKLKRSMTLAGIDIKHIEFPNIEIGHKEAMQRLFKKHCKEMAEALGYYIDLIGMKSMYGVDYFLPMR